MSQEGMIAQAERSLGLGEPNYIQAWYPGIGGNFPWCDAAITYWAWHSSNQGPVCFNSYYAYTVAHAERFQSAGRWHTDVAGISRGDIVFFDWGYSNSIGNIDHVGLVTSVSGGNVYTIEGNISNQCLRKVRNSSVIVGYGRPAYSGSTPAPSPQPASVYEPFPGASFFVNGRTHSIIQRMHDRLVAVGCNNYQSSAGGNVWGSGDKASYACWQRKLGYTGADADGIPGKTSWDKLHVPKYGS